MPHPRTRLRALVVAGTALAIGLTAAPAAHAKPSASELAQQIDKASNQLEVIVESYNAMNISLKKTQDDLKKAQDDLASTKRDLGGAQDQADELKRQKQVISNCIKLLGELGAASRAGNTALAQQKEAEATPVCNEADRYLD